MTSLDHDVQTKHAHYLEVGKCKGPVDVLCLVHAIRFHHQIANKLQFFFQRSRLSAKRVNTDLNCLLSWKTVFMAELYQQNLNHAAASSARSHVSLHTITCPTIKFYFESGSF